MNLDEYQKAWKANAGQMNVKIDVDSLSKEVQQSHGSFQSMIFWRDVREAGGSLLLIPIWFAIGIPLSLPWTWYLTVPALIWVAGFFVVDRRRHPQRPSEPGEPLLYYVKESLTQVEHQIWLLRNVFWWYLLPFCISIMAFFLHVAWISTRSWLAFATFAGTLSLFLFVVYRLTYWLNQRAVRVQLEPRRQDLLKLVESLERETNGDSNDEENGDIMELVSSLNKRDEQSSSDWANTWNRIVPSWWAAAIVVVPTLVGALCGLYSGLRLQVFEMGPTLFQAVVGAVIPFELALAWVWWRSYQKQKQTDESASKDNKPSAFASDVDIDDSTSEQPRVLPKAPAILIVVLAVFLGIMAIVALISCTSHFGSNSTTKDAHRLSEPQFRDVSAFAADDVTRVDAWLRAQVDLAKYPSLVTAIVRDGKIVYGRAFGFENVAEGKVATLQTQYHVASVTKAFTASLAAILHEQGVVDLDQPVVKYLPNDVAISSTPELGATITLRQLASHTSGLPRRVPGRVQSVEGWYELEPKRLYKHLARVKLDSDPGTKELYSNLAFGLLGHALERAAGKPLDQLLQELIRNPLELKRTALQVNDKLQPATGYDDSGWNFERTHSFRERLVASGGLVTSAEDLAKFLAAQMEPGVFSPELLKELHARTRLSHGELTTTALGWSLGWNTFVGPTVKKNGGRSNCSAWIGFSPEYKTGVVVLTNCGGPDVDRIGMWLLERSVPDAYKPVSKHGHARVAPYSGVRWENNRPIVRLNDKWSPLVSINEIPVDRIVEFAKEEHGEKARKR